MQKSKGLDIEFKSKMKRGIFIFVLALFFAILSINAFAAKDFVIENRTSALFIVNGTTGNIIMAPSFGLVGIGTLAPATTLDVKGKANFTGNFSVMNASDTIFFVDNTSGKVGIGTTSPVSGLEVSAALGRIRITSTTNSNNVGLQLSTKDSGGTAGTAGYYFVKGTTNAATYLGLSSDDSTYAMVINKGGNVGIGTTTPDNLLTIRGTDADSYLDVPSILHLNITDTRNTTLTNMITLDHLLNNSDNATNTKAGVTGGIGLGILFRAVNNDSEIINVSFINATLVNAYNGSEVGALTFYTANKSGAESRLTPRLILNGSNVFIAPNGGNVGIGTTSPISLLHVKSGNKKGISVETDASVYAFAFYETSVTTTPMIGIKSGGSGIGIIENGYTGGGGELRIGSQTGQPITFYPAGAEKVRIDSTGRVGIGTTTPKDKLEVKGNISATGAVNFTNNTYFNETLYVINGNVGIGTSGPIARLDIQNAITSVRGMRITSTASSGQYETLLLNVGGNLDTGYSGFDINTNGQAITTGQALMSIEPTAGTTIPSLVITSGNVGIGTTSPGRALEVSGSINGTQLNISGPTNLAYGSGSVGIGTTNPVDKLDIRDGLLKMTESDVSQPIIDRELANVYGTIGPLSGTAGGVIMRALTDVDASAYRLEAYVGATSTTNPAITFRAAKQSGTSQQELASTEIHTQFQKFDGTALLTLQAGGNVGIGTTTPDQELHIIGNVTINDTVTEGAIQIDSTNDAILFKGENGSVYQPVYGSDDDLVLYLPFNAPNGSVQYDRSPYGNDGTLQGGINCNITQGKYGAGCYFDNETVDYINVGVGNIPNITNSITVSAWVNIRTNKNWNRIVTRDNWVTANENSWLLFSTATVFTFGVSEGTTQKSATSNAAPILGKWTYVAGTYDGSTVRLYIDGVLQSTTASSSISQFSRITSLTIGSNSASNQFNGSIDEVMLYKRALAPEEIRTHYLRGKGFGATGAVTANMFRIVNTSGARKLELNQTGFGVYINQSPIILVNKSDVRLGNTVMVDDLSNRVGIGTTVPETSLDVRGDGIITLYDGSTRGLIQARTGSTYKPLRLGGNGVEIWTGTTSATQKVTVDASGNVGIGTTSPLSLLHLNVTDNQNQSATVLFTLDHLLNNPENATNTKAGVTGGIGLGILFRAINNDSEIINVSFINASLVNAINGTEAGALTFYTANKSNKEARLVPRLVLNGSDVFIAPVGQGNTYINPNGGNVGIGTTTPVTPFEVIGTIQGTNVNVMTTATNKLIQLVSAGGTGSEPRLWFRNNAGTTVISFDAGGNSYINQGNVGIGTTSPATTLDVKGKANFTGNFSIMNTTETIFFVDNTSGYVGIGTARPGGKLTVQGGNVQIERTSAVDQWLVYKPSGTLSTSSPQWNIGHLSTNEYTIRTWDGTSNIDRVTVKPDGNFGIGTTTPGATLDVKGKANFTGNFSIMNTTETIFFVNNNTGRVGIGTKTPTDLLELSSNGNTGIVFVDRGNQNFAIGVKDGSDYLGFFQGVDVSGTPGMILQATTGNVGINTTTPAQTLTVQGTLNVTPAGQGSTPSIFVTSIGNVGIGTTSPGRALEVSGSINGTQLNISGPTNLAYGSGNVGIGTTSPVTKLTVYSGVVTVAGGSAAENAEQIRFNRIEDNARYNSIHSKISNGGAGFISTVSFLLHDTDNNNQKTVMQLESGGNVGINMTLPNVTVDISGGLRTNNATTNTCTAGELRGNLTASNSGKICICTGGLTWKCVAVS